MASVYVIDSIERRHGELNIPDGEGQLEELQALVDGYIEEIPIGRGYTLYVNDMARVNGTKNGFTIKIYNMGFNIWGNGVLVRVNRENGELRNIGPDIQGLVNTIKFW